MYVLITCTKLEYSHNTETIKNNSPLSFYHKKVKIESNHTPKTVLQKIQFKFALSAKDCKA